MLECSNHEGHMTKHCSPGSEILPLTFHFSRLLSGFCFCFALCLCKLANPAKDGFIHCVGDSMVPRQVAPHCCFTEVGQIIRCRSDVCFMLYEKWFQILVFGFTRKKKTKRLTGAV